MAYYVFKESCGYLRNSPTLVEIEALKMVDRKMTDLIGLEFHGLENAGREVGGVPNEVSQHILL